MAAGPTRLAIHAKLAADPTLTALVGDRIYFEVAPQSATFPLIVFFRSSGQRRWSFDGDPMRNDVWTVKAVTTGSATQAEEIDAACEAALASVTVTGRDVLLHPHRESDVQFSEVEDGVTYRHCGGLYRLVTE